MFEKSPEVGRTDYSRLAAAGGGSVKSDLEISFANKHHRSTFYEYLLVINKPGTVDMLSFCSSGSVYLEEGLSTFTFKTAIK